MRITDYSIIESDKHDELVEAVCKSLKDGWVPCGGVCVWFQPATRDTSDELRFATGADSVIHYTQALVKYGP